MKKYVRSTNIYCPCCGKDEGVSLWVEEGVDFIYCEACRQGYRIFWEGLHTGYGDYKNCDTCEYEGTSPHIKPCRLCVEASEWKPKHSPVEKEKEQ